MTLPRRSFLASAITAPLAAGSVRRPPDLSIAPFRYDVTPPLGHSLCGGWIKPALAVDDPLEAIGYVLTGCGDPIVICAVDWTGILNDAHFEWRKALADAAGTTPERVAVQCVHPHNAPFACLSAQRIVEEFKELPAIVDRDFFKRCLDRCHKAVKTAMKSLRRVTHIGHGEAIVEKVASNRRVHRDASGKVLSMRGSSCKVQKLIDLPEGTIDPRLKSVTFFDGDESIVTCHWYACHPMSHYGDGRVTPDFVGLARNLRQKAQPSTTHIYFTGCAGNVAAGKYNDGDPKNRTVLRDRIHMAMLASEKAMTKQPIGTAEWKTESIQPSARSSPTAKELHVQIANPKNSTVQRNRPAFQLAFVNRCDHKQPIIVSGLSINEVSMLHLPAECFVEYQLLAQRINSKRFVATAAYGDGGPWYIPTAAEVPHGGYEVEMMYADSKLDDQLTKAIRNVLT